MKKLFFACLFFCLTLMGSVYAQIVTIPDANFKAKLIALGLDTNADGEIQNAEVQSLTGLNVANSNISSLVGISAFTSLISLNCSDNNLTSLDLNALTALSTLYCQNNLLTDLSFSPTFSLNHVNAANNPIDTLAFIGSNLLDLTLNGCSALQYLDCSDGNMISLDITGCTALQYLDCSTANLSTLDVTFCTNLQTLNISATQLYKVYCQGTALSNLILNNCTQLAYLNCSSTQLSGTLDISQVTFLDTILCQNTYIDTLLTNNNLKCLICYNTLINSFDFTNYFNLSFLDCHNTLISALDVTGCTYIQKLYVNDCANLQSLNCGIYYLDSLNINGCFALQSLDCSSSQISGLDVSFCPNLSNLLVNSAGIQYLYCQEAQLTSLDLSGCYNLEAANCSNNPLTNLILPSSLLHLDCSYTALPHLIIHNTGLISINCAYTTIDTLDLENNFSLETVDASNCLNLTYLKCNDGNIFLSSLDVTNCTNLQYLNCETNPLQGLDVSTCSSLQSLYCSSVAPVSLDVSGLSNLVNLTCDGFNGLTLNGCTSLQNVYSTSMNTSALNFSNLPNLQNLYHSLSTTAILTLNNCPNLLHLECNDNQITSLDVSTCPLLQYLNCTNNVISTLNMTGLTDLTYLNCANNSIMNLNTTDLIHLIHLECSNNWYTNLDVTHCYDLDYLDCSGMESLLIKNGKILSYLNFDNCNGLKYVCVDDSATEITQVILEGQANLVSIVPNTYCSFFPANNFNSISGRVAYDFDTNGCTLADPVSPFLMVKIHNNVGGYDGYFVTDNTGNYASYESIGTYVVSPLLQNSSLFAVSPPNLSVNFANMNNNNIMQDFCITPIGATNDIEVVMSPVGVARPGFDASYTIWLHNKGNTVVSGDIHLDFLANNMSFFSASQVPSAQTSSSLTWHYSNLSPFESKMITVIMNLLPPPTNNLGDSILFTVNAVVPNDISPNDNAFSFNQALINAYDPNDKICLEEKNQPNSKIGDYLHYLVRFQNTGNYSAEKVVIIDAINPTQFDLSSLQILASSHPLQLHIYGYDEVQFYFDHIMLADSFTNEPESHGYVLFKIKTNDTLPPNSDVLMNSSYIYFDYNAAVSTNACVTTFTDALGINHAIQSFHFQCYPNPANTFLTIETEKRGEFVILNLLGQELKRVQIQHKENIDISGLANGIYWIKEANTHQGQTFMKE